MKLTRPATVAATVLLALGGAGAAQAQPDEPHHPDPAAPGPSAAPGPPPAPGPGPAPQAAPATRIDRDGTYKVGTDILPGTYSTAGPIAEGACYWKRVNNDEMPDNALTKKPQVVRIEATDTAFTTSDCQPWQQTNAAPPPQAAPSDLLGQLGAFIGKGILNGGPG
ncbi:hypothetical protein [Mycobacterium sp. IS-3022]|uniref:hypothetical protein n=1 Tax=Mycobacterium sp. IS-3022 TaxID=1772277 RepID=UPI0007415C2C|nr:hypothetical protein [Mycobacterium sp. IS-3022]KUI03680.1 hypothetical protein AU188_22920 [Mycobacterium sp. IS-3022]